jgi:hypothetical protein
MNNFPLYTQLDAMDCWPTRPCIGAKYYFDFFCKKAFFICIHRKHYLTSTLNDNSLVNVSFCYFVKHYTMQSYSQGEKRNFISTKKISPYKIRADPSV